MTLNPPGETALETVMLDKHDIFHRLSFLLNFLFLGTISDES